MSNINNKRLGFTHLLNVLGLSICILGVVLNRSTSLSYASVFSDKLMQFWYLEMSAITVGFVLIQNMKVRFYLFLAAVLTHLNNTSLVLYLQSSFSDIVFLHYLHGIAIYIFNYYVLQFGPLIIGRTLYVLFNMNTGAGMCINSTDVYILKLHRYMIVFHSLYFIEYLVRHSNPVPEFYDTSQLVIIYNLMPFGLAGYLAFFYGLLIREAIFSSRK